MESPQPVDQFNQWLSANPLAHGGALVMFGFLLFLYGAYVIKTGRARVRLFGEITGFHAFTYGCTLIVAGVVHTTYGMAKFFG
jgi:uncharacterized membrane protein